MAPPLKVAWISDFPVEWLDGLPPELCGLPRQHPLTWQRVLLEELQGRPNLELHIIVLRKGIPKDVRFERNGVCFHILKTRGLTRAPTLFWSDTLLARRAIHAIKPDLVHAWGTERGAALVAQRLKQPHLTTIQGLLTWYRTALKLNAHEWFAAWMEERVLRRTGHVTTESTFAVRFLRDRHPGLQVHQVEHAPHRLFHQVERQVQTRPVRLLFSGHLDRRKGADVLFGALSQLCRELDFKLVHAGSRDERLIRSLCHDWPEVWKRYQPVGSLTPAQIGAELARATMLVLPTRADTSPNAVKEAVVAGVPVVATRVGGIPDYVVHSENGWLIPSASPALLAQAIRDATRHEWFGQGKVSAVVLDKMRDYLSPARMADDFLATYTSVLERVPPD